MLRSKSKRFVYVLGRGEGYWPRRRRRRAGSEPSASAWPAAPNIMISAASRRFVPAAARARSQSGWADKRKSRPPPRIRQPGRRHPAQLRPHLRGRSAANGRASRRTPSTRAGGGSKRGEPQVFRLFGYAGVGKTTLARHIAEGARGETAFAAFTGKAALVMRSKGCAGATTIHALIYRASEGAEGAPTFTLNADGPASKAGLIVIDECSMVDAELARDLLSFGKTILVLGDPFQLPPVKGAGFFTDGAPDVK